MQLAFRSIRNFVLLLFVAACCSLPSFACSPPASQRSVTGVLPISVTPLSGCYVQVIGVSATSYVIGPLPISEKVIDIVELVGGFSGTMWEDALSLYSGVVNANPPYGTLAVPDVSHASSPAGFISYSCLGCGVTLEVASTIVLTGPVQRTVIGTISYTYQ